MNLLFKLKEFWIKYYVNEYEIMKRLHMKTYTCIYLASFLWLAIVAIVASLIFHGSVLYINFKSANLCNYESVMCVLNEKSYLFSITISYEINVHYSKHKSMISNFSFQYVLMFRINFRKHPNQYFKTP